MYPTQRKSDEEVAIERVAEMQGVEHLGKYVFEMTQAKIKSLQAGKEILDAAPIEPGTDINAENDDEEAGNDEVDVNEEFGRAGYTRRVQRA